MGVLLLTGSCVAAVAVADRASVGAAGLVAHHGAVAAAAPVADTIDDAVDVPYPTAEVQVGTPSTVPSLPSADDPRLRAVPRMAPLQTAAAPHAVNVPVVMYHFLREVNNPQRDRLGWNLSVTPDDFALQIAFLKREGFTTVSLSDVMNAMETGAPLPKRPIVLTFDDGYTSFATVGAPLLSRAGFTGTTFVVSGFVGKPGFMSAEQVHQVAAMGMTVGAHTQHHVDLARVPFGVAQQEIAGSRTALQALSGQPVTDFAYPSGQFNQQVVGLVHQAGFRCAVTTIPGVRHDAGLPYTLTRVRVSGGEPLQLFAQTISAGLAPPGAPEVPTAPVAPPAQSQAAPPSPPALNPPVPARLRHDFAGEVRGPQVE
jgi:peptidoglycan/xylan/chitin deacetylase (PgdA/CDA1 family)